ncbi:MAG: hypothetical protein WD875_06235 [Pirellulales bacterium]
MRLSFLFAAAFTATLAITLAGCGDDNGKKGADKAVGGEHDHPSDGPHKGVLIELGDEEYHGEVVHDDATHKVTVYILDSEAKNAVPVEAKDVTINVVADGKGSNFAVPAMPLDGESDGKSSRFELTDEQLCDGMGAEGAEARLTVHIAGKQYQGKISVHDHDHDKHPGHDQDDDHEKDHEKVPDRDH